jgi:predicted GIY-YIG superfamily endonuclease
MSSKTYLYWIHYPESNDPLTEGYIGVSKAPETRYKYHSHPKRNNNQHLFRAMQKGCELTILEEFDVAEEAYSREEHYRPTEHIGFNIIPGGSEKGRPPVHKNPTWFTNRGMTFPVASCTHCKKEMAAYQIKKHRKFCESLPTCSQCDNIVKRPWNKTCSRACSAKEIKSSP